MEIACVCAKSILFDSPFDEALLDAVEEIELILGRDVSTQDVFLIYGRDRLGELATELDSKLVDVLMIEVDRQSDELNQILALVQIAKNRCDYVECA